MRAQRPRHNALNSSPPKTPKSETPKVQREGDPLGDSLTHELPNDPLVAEQQHESTDPLGAPNDSGSRPPAQDRQRQTESAVAAPTSGELPYRRELEQAFGEDLSGVIATLGVTDLPTTYGAEAIAQGESVMFAQARPDKATVAHEVAHVIQHRQHGGAQAQGLTSVSEPSEPAEQEASTVAEAAASGEQVSVRERPGRGIMRKKQRNFAIQDRYNRGQVKSNKTDGRRLGKDVVSPRPSVTLGKGKKKTDTFKLKPDAEGCYIVDGVAESRRQFKRTKKGEYWALPNPAAPKQALYKGKKTWFIFCQTTSVAPNDTQYRTKDSDEHRARFMTGGAWIRAFDFEGGAGYKLLRKLKGKAYSNWRPKAPKGKSKKVRWVVSETSPEEKKLRAQERKNGPVYYLLPGQSGEQNRLTSDSGFKTNEGYVSVNLNLAQGDAPGVAADIAKPKERFEVYVEREVPLYKKGSRTPTKTKKAKYSYGLVNGEKKRRGWIWNANLTSTDPKIQQAGDAQQGNAAGALDPESSTE